MSTQLTQANSLDVKNIVFGKPKDGSIPNSTVAFKRLPILYRYPDGSVGDLVIPARGFSFGLSLKTDMQTGKTDGYTLPICLYNQNDPSEEEKAWVVSFNKMVEHIKQHLVDNRDDIGKYELEMNDLKNFTSSTLYYKKEKGKIVAGTGPILYPKVMQNKKSDLITTPFFNEKGEDIDPLTVLAKRCTATAAIKIESVFIGSKVSLQIKLYEAEIKLLDTAPVRLLRKPQTNSQVVMESKAESKQEDSDKEDSIKGDSEDESDDEHVAAQPAVAAAPVASKPAAARRTVARKA